jgi:hypothetical protein
MGSPLSPSDNCTYNRLYEYSIIIIIIIIAYFFSRKLLQECKNVNL